MTTRVCRIDDGTRALLRKRQAKLLLREGKRVSFNEIIKQALEAARE